MNNLSYITNDYARGYVSSRWNARKGVHIPLSFIDICNGNMHDAILFSQIMYWHEPSQETGKTRLRRWHDGQLWLAKNHEDWYAECRVKKSTVRKCLTRLKGLNLINYELHGEKGNKTPFIQVNWDTFALLMQEWERNNQPSNVVTIPDTKEHTPVTEGQGGVIQQDIPLSSEVKPNTKSTTESTKKDDDVRAPESQPVKETEKPSSTLQEKDTQSDIDRVEALLDEMELFKGARYKDRQLFHSDFDDYTLEDWLAGIDQFKKEIARKIQEQGKDYTALPYKYLETCVSSQSVKRAQQAIADSQPNKPLAPYHKPHIVDDTPEMSDEEAKALLEDARKVMESINSEKASA